MYAQNLKIEKQNHLLGAINPKVLNEVSDTQAHLDI